MHGLITAPTVTAPASATINNNVLPIGDVYTGSVGTAGEQLQGGTANATPTTWFASGPSPVANANINLETTTNNANIAGPITSILSDPTDPDIIYVAAAGGGAWKTINGGVTWAPLFDNMSDVQTFTVTGVNPGTDTYSLLYTNPLTGIQTDTASMPYNATAQVVQSALNAVVGAGNLVVVSQVAQANGVTNTVTFSGGNLAGVNVAPLTATTTGAALLSLGVKSVTVTSGTGYTEPVAVINPIAGSGDPAPGSPGAATATVIGAVQNNVVITSGGAGYAVAPTVVFEGGGGTVPAGSPPSIPTPPVSPSAR